MYFVFQSPNIMHNAPRLDQRSARAASNIIANGKCAVERRNDSPHVLQLALYYSVYFFCPPLPSSCPTTLPFQHTLPGGTVLLTRSVSRVTQLSWPEFLILMERIKVDGDEAERSERIISEDEFSE